MKSESCWKLYNIQSKNSIMVMWSVQLCIARMGVDGGGGGGRAAPHGPRSASGSDRLNFTNYHISLFALLCSV